MKRAFTLVELMIVIVVIVTLMAITFRLSGLGGDASRRNMTISRMQRLENALSGYFAAFGSYPPVALHAKRNVYLDVDDFGNQRENENSNLEWDSVEAACRAQPLAAKFPFSTRMSGLVRKMSDIYRERANSSESRYAAYQTEFARRQYSAGFTSITSPNQVSGYNKESSWQEVKIFQFGLMSFLMPRYLFMVEGLDQSQLDNCAQWTANNRLSANPNDGEAFSSWRDQFRKSSLVKRIPSQAVCARWMPNFERILTCTENKEFFGVRVKDTSAYGSTLAAGKYPTIKVYENYKVLDEITVKDGWFNDFYYYSPPPFQSYRLWSAGPNGRTFPPWIPLNAVTDLKDRATAANWAADDIMYFSN